MIINQTIWKWEPEKITLFFISQTGHGKPLVNDFEYIAPDYAAEMKAEVARDNTMFRVFSSRFPNYVFVIYKKHYNTRDNAAAIKEAYQKVRELYPDQVIKTTSQNQTILAALQEEPNLEFYTKSRGPLIK